jgi:carboxyl-terminal processing protease
VFLIRSRNLLTLVVLLVIGTIGICSANSKVTFKPWLMDFHALHGTVSQKYAFTQWRKIDWEMRWNIGSRDVIFAILDDTSVGYYSAVRKYLFSIPDGHVAMFPTNLSAKALNTELKMTYLGAGYGLGITHLDSGKIIVYYLTPGGPGEIAGIQEGAKIIQWNQKPIEKAIAEVSSLWVNDTKSLATLEHRRLEQERLLTRSSKGSQAIVTFQNPGENMAQTQILMAVPDDFDSLNHGNFVAKASRLEVPIVQSRILAGGQGYIKVTQEAGPPKAQEVLSEFGNALSTFMAQGVSRVIVDLRGNLGGSDMLAANLAGFFYKEKTFYETATGYDSDTHLFETIGQVDINPQTPYYDGPVVALVNPATISSGEGVALAIQKSPNGLVMGFHGTNGSFGMVLSEEGSIIPFSIEDNNYDIMIPIGQSLDSENRVQLDSRDGVGGVTPDIIIPRTADNLIRFGNGEDVELETAVWSAGPKFQEILDRAVSDEGVPGAVMALSSPTGSWVGAAGKADLSTDKAMTINTQVRIAGITKVFTSALIMNLVEEGRLMLDDTVEHWLPGALPINGDKITIGMLLNHTSGIPDHEAIVEWKQMILDNPGASWTLENVLNILKGHQSQFIEPGIAFTYCNTGYFLLGMIAQAATGDTVANETKRRFFQPLGMRRTALTPSGIKTEPYARDYARIGEALVDTSGWNISWDWTAGSAVTSASDMLRWTGALFSGKVVNKTTLDQMLTPVAPATNYGSGLMISPSSPQFFGEKTISHSGANPGVQTMWLHFPDSDRTLFVALNRFDEGMAKVDSNAVMTSIINSVRDILWQ